MKASAAPFAATAQQTSPWSSPAASQAAFRSASENAAPPAGIRHPQDEGLAVPTAYSLPCPASNSIRKTCVGATRFGLYRPCWAQTTLHAPATDETGALSSYRRTENPLAPSTHQRPAAMPARQNHTPASPAAQTISARAPDGAWHRRHRSHKTLLTHADTFQTSIPFTDSAPFAGIFDSSAPIKNGHP